MDRKPELQALTSEIQNIRSRQADVCARIDELEEQLEEKRKELRALTTRHQDCLEQVVIIKSEMLAEIERAK